MGLLRINERTHGIGAGSWSPRGLLFQCVHATTPSHLPCQSVVSSASMAVSPCCYKTSCWPPPMTLPHAGHLVWHLIRDLRGLLVAVTFGFGIALFWAIAPFVILDYYLNCVASICLFYIVYFPRHLRNFWSLIFYLATLLIFLVFQVCCSGIIIGNSLCISCFSIRNSCCHWKCHH